MYHRVEEVKLERVVSDDYQRPIKQEFIRYLLRNWKPNRATHPVVSYRDGRFHCIDGQHRIEVYKRLGVTHVHCVVWYGLTMEDEAGMRLAANHVKPDTAVEKYRLGIEAGDELLAAIDEIVTDCGYRVAYRASSNDQGSRVVAVATLSQLVRSHGLEHLRDVLSTLHDAWGDDSSATKFWMLHGMSTFLHKAKSKRPVSRERLVSVLRYYTPNDILASAHASAIEGMNFGVARAIAHLYNYRLSTERKVVIGE